MSKYSPQELCGRIAQVRLETAGPRGKSAFAKKLGLSPSTYDYYESSRVPPAEVLVKIASVAGVDLRWLLTGEAASGSAAVGAENPIVQRAAALLNECPSVAAPLAAFLEILSESAKFPSKLAVDASKEAAKPQAGGASVAVEQQKQMKSSAKPLVPSKVEGQAAGADSSESEGSRGSWIPVLGRSAAGVPQFWAEGEDTSAVTTLDELIARHTGGQTKLRSAEATDTGGGPAAEVQLITLTQPDGDVTEFVACAEIKARHADAFALRIDGDSMSPEIKHGDLVVLSPSSPATDGRAAVVQLTGQIGVTCKLFRRDGGRVHLVPINERLEPMAVEDGEVLWALRVLAKIRSS